MKPIDKITQRLLAIGFIKKDQGIWVPYFHFIFTPCINLDYPMHIESIFTNNGYWLALGKFCLYHQFEAIKVEEDISKNNQICSASSLTKVQRK